MNPIRDGFIVSYGFFFLGKKVILFILEIKIKAVMSVKRAFF